MGWDESKVNVNGGVKELRSLPIPSMGGWYIYLHYIHLVDVYCKCVGKYIIHGPDAMGLWSLQWGFFWLEYHSGTIYQFALPRGPPSQGKKTHFPYDSLGGRFKYSWNFHPWKNDPIWWFAYFFNTRLVQPPPWSEICLFSSFISAFLKIILDIQAKTSWGERCLGMFLGSKNTEPQEVWLDV